MPKKDKEEEIEEKRCKKKATGKGKVTGPLDQIKVDARRY